jgi:hypothetical protein
MTSSKTVFSDHRGQETPKMGPKMGLKRGPKTTQAENAENTKIVHSTANFNDFPGPRVSLWLQNGVPKGVRNGISTPKALESLLEASWKPLGALLEPLGALLDALIALLEPKTLQLEPQHPPVKPDQAVGPESTDAIMCLRPCNHLPTSV